MSGIEANYSQVIDRYITQRQPAPVWPRDLSERCKYISRNPFFIPDLAGVPNNCLPLLLIVYTSKFPGMVGILNDTQVLYADIYHIQYPIKAANIEIHSNFEKLFTQKLNRYDSKNPYTNNDLLNAVYLIDLYQMWVRRLRNQYPEIEALLIDPPEISSDLRKAAKIAEAWVSNL